VIAQAKSELLDQLPEAVVNQLPTDILEGLQNGTLDKIPEDVGEVPASVTAVPRETLERVDVRYVIDAARFAPNVFMHEFTARKLSNPRFRGIGSSPNNPAVTTYLDGVPQLNANSSSIELIDVEQIELIRGPRSALFGRNAIGGVITVASRMPSLATWSGNVTAPFGNFNSRDVRGSVSGPLIADRLAVSFAAGYAARDGFTQNDLTGNTLDDRSAGFTKLQLRWTPNNAWDARFIFSGERARDGDFALHDLGALRENPFHASRSLEGFTNRDIVAPTFVLTRRGSRVDVASTTGLVRWKTQDVTDLDYTGLPLLSRDNTEKDVQFTQDVRFSSAAGAPVTVSDAVVMNWQLGGSFFTQRYDQDAVNSFSPFVLSPYLSFPISQTSPLSSLNDVGFGVYGQSTWTVRNKVDLAAGARVDWESKEADIRTFFSPAFAPPSAVTTDADFVHVSPHFSASYHATPEATIYGTVGEGYKAGGFNAASPAGLESYSEETSWNYEGGLKSMWLDRRVSLAASVFHIRWDSLQLNLPDLRVPGQFYIANGGGATSSGVELELAARPHPNLSLHGAFGYTRARFGDDSFSSGLSVGGNTLPNSPEYTLRVGADYSRPIRNAEVYVRGDVTAYGSYAYDDLNMASQDAYAITEIRTGFRMQKILCELWVRNAFDSLYVPIAFAYGALAPSGFIGEPGAPRTFGVRLGVDF